MGGGGDTGGTADTGGGDDREKTVDPRGGGDTSKNPRRAAPRRGTARRVSEKLAA